MSTKQSYGSESAVQEFEAAMHAANIIPELGQGEISGDGSLVRFQVKGDRKGTRNGWAVFFNDGVPAGEFGSWRTGESHPWCSKPAASLSAAERADIKRRSDQARAERVQEEKTRQAETAAKIPDSQSHLLMRSHSKRTCTARSTAAELLSVVTLWLMATWHTTRGLWRRARLLL